VANLFRSTALGVLVILRFTSGVIAFSNNGSWGNLVEFDKLH
jgi:hypothetical protein